MAISFAMLREQVRWRRRLRAEIAEGISADSKNPKYWRVTPEVRKALIGLRAKLR